MAIKITSNIKKKSAPDPQEPSPVSKKKGGLSFLKRGQEAQEIMQQEEHQAEQSYKSKMLRYWVPQDGDGDITFLDGSVVDGKLNVTYYHEHNVNLNGRWNNFFICTQDDDICPICEGGSKPAFVGALTVISHKEYLSKKDNKVHKDEIRLFVAKRDTIKQLTKLAIKRGGLAGCRFDVSRTGDKSAAVGNVFDFTNKKTMAEIAKLYGSDKVKPLDYDELFASLYIGAKDLRKMGFGIVAPVGTEAASSGEFDNDL